MLDERREAIDELDAQILNALARRVVVSREIQHLRRIEGGSRLDLEREAAVRRRYAAALGERGARLADLILELSRGEAPSRSSGRGPS